MRSLFLVALVVCACSPVDSVEASDVDTGGAGSSTDSVSVSGASAASAPVKASSGGATVAASSAQVGGTSSTALGGSSAVAVVAGGTSSTGGTTSKGGASSAGGMVSAGGSAAKASTVPTIDQSCHFVGASGTDYGQCGPATQGRRTCDAFGTCNVCEPQLGDVRAHLDCDFDGICEQRSNDLNCGACGYACPGGGTCHIFNAVYQCI